MLESALSALIVTILKAGLTARSITATVKQGYQPRQQTNMDSALILFYHISTVNIGWPLKYDTYDAVHDWFIHTEVQNRESRYQISTLVPQSPATSTYYPASDYALAAAQIMQSDVTIATMLASSVGVQHITDIRSLKFKTDKDQFEENPTFDIILSHQDIVTSTVPIINDYEFRIGAV